MTLRQSTIFIDRLRVYAFHGVMAQERRVGGWFTVTLRVHYNIEKAMATDNVCHTLDYATLCQLVKRQMATPSDLLEHVAGRIAQEIFGCFPQTTALTLQIVKLNPPMGADCKGAGVEIEMTND